MVYFVGLTPIEKKRLSNKLGGGPEMNSQKEGARHMKLNNHAQGRHSSWIEEFPMNKEEEEKCHNQHQEGTQE